ncbi:hypothetical protein EJ08DRAFT_268477 [Tothia fuscella]|uniref:DUF1308 domain-containing protein n=1 Tax=Tothia fuscella TaxID=1048955 RepID=A0A9P4NPR9_9PEZI|nr:hypothetical protein EJ08DRAFT_268477 [Tothia fuscella]
METNAASSHGEGESMETLLQSLNITAPDEILRRCRILLDEIQLFAEACDKKKHYKDWRRPEANYSPFRTILKAEAKQMEKIITTKMDPKRVQQLVGTSNFSFVEAIWNIAKSRSAISVIHSPSYPAVDIVAQNGLQWIKVSTMAEKRLLMDMAKQGWDWQGASDSDSDGDKDLKDSKVKIDLENEEDDIPLVKTAKRLIKASREKRVIYRWPQAQLVLTRIFSGNKDIDALLDSIRLLGCTVQTAGQIPLTPSIDSVLDDLVVDDRRSFSTTLNIDCTILLGLVSDISHGRVEEQPWFNNDIRRQIKSEEVEKLMPNILWPTLCGHPLICTKLAIYRMREIVDLIGTPTEKIRTAILMGDDTSLDPQALLDKFQEHSDYPVPATWQLPIQVFDTQITDLSPLAQAVADELSDLNVSVFMTGWTQNFTTITSNRVAIKHIEKTFEANRTNDSDVGPDVWVCPLARSLVAKEKNRGQGGGSRESTDGYV